MYIAFSESSGVRVSTANQKDILDYFNNLVVNAADTYTTCTCYGKDKDPDNNCLCGDGLYWDPTTNLAVVGL
jgi:hypothetical protein